MTTGYSKFTKDTVRTKWVEEWATDFLEGLDRTSNKQEIEEYCANKKAEFEAKCQGQSQLRAAETEKKIDSNSWKNAAATHMSQIRNAIKAWQVGVGLNESNSYPQQTKDGIVHQHLALLIMGYPSTFHKERQVPTEEKKQQQRSSLESISCVDEYQSVIEKLLDSNDWKELTVGLIAATGRRPSEVLKSAEFDQIRQFEVGFSGQLKAKGEKRKYPTFTLIESAKIVDGLLRLRRMPEIKELKGQTLAKIDSGNNSEVNRRVVEFFSSLINPPLGEVQLSAKNLRASYAAIAIYLFCPHKQSPAQFIKERLGHVGDATAANYEDYQVTDQEGVPLGRGAWLERIGEKMAMTVQKITMPRVRMTEAARQVFDDQVFLLFGDQVSRIDELVRLAKIGKDFEEGKLVREVVKVVEVKREIEKVMVNEVKPEKRNFEEMSNTELFGSNAPNSGKEKIKRAVEIIKTFNEQQGTKSDWWAINTSVLKDLTNCRTSVVQDFLNSEEGRFQVTEYNDLHGLGYHHNRGRGKITDYIKLDSANAS